MNIDLIGLAIVFVSVLISITLHEAMHAYASFWLGDNTAKEQGRLTFNPIAHIDLFSTILLPLLLFAFGLPPFGMAKPVPFDPARLKYEEFGVALVGLAGPLTNLGLALMAGIVLQLAHLPEFAVYALGIFTLVNLSFFLFNMIPFPPLDGSRVLYALAPDFVRRGMEFIESLGIIATLGFFLVFYTLLSEPFSIVLRVIFRFITGGALAI